jgi:hypothetical protein
MIAARRSTQFTFGHGFIKDAIEDVWEPWHAPSRSRAGK